MELQGEDDIRDQQGNYSQHPNPRVSTSAPTAQATSTTVSATPASANPPGWRENPSRYRDRCLQIFFAILGALAAVSLQPQLEWAAFVWSAFFLGTGICALCGGIRRWASFPWAVTLTTGFAVLSFLLGIATVVATSTLATPLYWSCLGIGALSVLAIPFAMRELLASLQYLRRLSRRNISVWRAFWGLSPRRRQRGHIELPTSNRRLRAKNGG